MPEIEIRPVVLSDINALNQLEPFFHTDHVWQMERLINHDQVNVEFREVRLPRPLRIDYPYNPQKITQESLQGVIILVAVHAGTPIGYIRFRPQTMAIWISDMIVQEPMRRKGIGTALVLAAREWATQHGLHRLVIEMQSKNVPAIHFALNTGFEFCGYNEQYYPNQDISVLFGQLIR